jgi:anthranilate synthase component 1
VGTLKRNQQVESVTRELPGDTLTLAGAFLRLGLADKPCLAFEQVEGMKPSRYSYLFFEPFETLRVRDGSLTVEREGGKHTFAGKPLETLKERLESYRTKETEGVPPFACGAVGYLGYDCVRYLERIELPEAGTGDDEACFVLFRFVLVLDHGRQRALLVGNVFDDTKEGPSQRGGGASPLSPPHVNSAAMRARLEAIALHLMEGRESPLPVQASFGGGAPAAEGPREFTKAVARVKSHIRQGDIFQCVLSRRETVRLDAHAFDLYREIRRVNPSPYHYYFNAGGSTLVGASPEPLVRIEDGVAHTCPIAGTRPRGADEAEDRRHEKNLLASVKEKAEHLMLVDLSRNDLGRVCKPGTVRVTEYMAVQRFSHVMHLVSTVVGKLLPSKTPLDALFASFPAGTLTGAPKIRAMEIISALEKVRRGIYGGAVVLYDFSGKLDSCITIRSAVVNGGLASIQAGAGIVADSTAARELEEIRNKCGAVRKAVELLSERSPRAALKRAGVLP